MWNYIVSKSSFVAHTYTHVEYKISAALQVSFLFYCRVFANTLARECARTHTHAHTRTRMHTRTRTRTRTHTHTQTNTHTLAHTGAVLWPHLCGHPWSLCSSPQSFHDPLSHSPAHHGCCKSECVSMCVHVCVRMYVCVRACMLCTGK
jgi:hypothetical protein